MEKLHVVISRSVKSIDTVDHEILLSKLEHGIHGVPLKWFKTFLTQQ